MQLQVGQTGGCDDVAYSSRMLGRGAVMECQCKPEAGRIEPELVERARLRNLRAMLEAVISILPGVAFGRQRRPVIPSGDGLILSPAFRRASFTRSCAVLDNERATRSSRVPWQCVSS